MVKKIVIPFAFLVIATLAWNGLDVGIRSSSPTVSDSTKNSLSKSQESKLISGTPNAGSLPSGNLNQQLSSPLVSSQVSTIPKTEIVETISDLMKHPVAMVHKGGEQVMVLAKDELYVRDADGKGSIITITEPRNAGDMLQEIERIRSTYSVEPELVLYLEGSPRNEANRRIVTSDLLIQASSQDVADKLALKSGLALKKAPLYANGSYIYQAESSPAALAFFTKNLDSQDVKVTPLLASQSIPRALPNDPLVKRQWHLKNSGQKLMLGGGLFSNATTGIDINVESAWAYGTNATVGNATTGVGYWRGNGVTIGIVDDGLEQNHPDLAANVDKTKSWDWNGNDNDPTPSGYYSKYLNKHGTACAGNAAAVGNNKIGVCGSAPEAKLAGLRLTAAANTDDQEAEAMLWYKDSIAIKSNSWGPNDNGLTLQAPDSLTEAALKYGAEYGRGGKGTIFVWAAGNGLQNNDDSNYDGYANSIYTIAISAIDSSGSQSYYSEPGANIVVCTPSGGDPTTTLGITTTDLKGVYGYNTGALAGEFKGLGDYTQTFSGTSSACPTAAGVVALILQRNPNLGWRDVQDILIRTASKNDSGDGDWTTNGAGIPFNHKYGAGLVNATAAVSMAGNRTSSPTGNQTAYLGSQKSITSTNSSSYAIAASATVNVTLSVSGEINKAEHTTLKLSVSNIPKGNLTIQLKSPGNTTSTLCEPHADTSNTFSGWKFMTVHNWGENPNGNWTLSVSNSGVISGNLTGIELNVFGSNSTSSSNPPPVVTLAASTTRAAISSNITLNATAIDLTANGSAGNVTNVEFFQSINGTTQSIGNATTSPYSMTWNTANLTAGNYTLTVNATDSEGAVGVSKAVTVKLDPALLAGWDFETLSSSLSKLPILTALMSTRTYAANFGTANSTILLNGNNGSSLWSYSNGELFADYGTTLNAGASFSTNTAQYGAIMLRAGKNLSANNKSMVFRLPISSNATLGVSYDSKSYNPYSTGYSGGFTTHSWAWSSNATTWTTIGTQTPSLANYSTLTLPTTTVTPSGGFVYLKLTLTGATSPSGYNLIDNIQITSTPSP